MDFLTQSKTYLRRFRSITNNAITFTVLMVLYCIRTTLSYHHRYERTYSKSCALPIRALVLCSQEQWKLFSGHILPHLFTLDEIAVLTLIVMHLPNHMHHHTLFRSLKTLFNVFVQISSIIKVYTQYLVAVDCYLNWPIIERAHECSKELIACLRKLFATFAIPDELASNCRPEFVATATSTFLKNWRFSNSLSSVAFPIQTAGQK